MRWSRFSASSFVCWDSMLVCTCTGLSPKTLPRYGNEQQQCQHKPYESSIQGVCSSAHVYYMTYWSWTVKVCRSSQHPLQHLICTRCMPATGCEGMTGWTWLTSRFASSNNVLHTSSVSVQHTCRNAHSAHWSQLHGRCARTVLALQAPKCHLAVHQPWRRMHV